ncbi:MAG: hypothetical protein OEZ01_05035 [Candidatus Heimdallarchaeota archaeon]|nr:hypothetical protein [Candidatus Heimdallarchaeota archaeon]MDH5645347.1 hypothetical protein [Candidatus Heimdallarchaeota archaeon]
MNTIKELVQRNTTHLSGMFTIHADGAFLNGAGLGSGEDKNRTTVKTYYRHKAIPYVSSQAWRRWLRNTLIDETGWKASEIEAVMWNKKGNTSKVAGQLDPLNYPEDDIFGYMFAVKGGEASKKDESTEDDDEKKADRRLPTKGLIRNSPFKSSLLRGVASLTRVAKDDGYVHLRDDTPVPYTTQFYSGELSALFGLDVYRLGVFEKKGSVSEELDEFLISENKDLIDTSEHPMYKDGTLVMRKELIPYQNSTTMELLKALARLRGGAKLAQFGVDVSPRLMIVVGMKSGNLLFDDLLIELEGQPGLNLEALKQIISDYKDRFTTSVFIGYRTGYLANEKELSELSEVNGVKIIHGSPIEIVDKLTTELS